MRFYAFRQMGATQFLLAYRRDTSSVNRSPCRLAVPEKIFALFVRSIFSTATDSPPRFIRHRRRSAPNPTPRDPLGNSEISPTGGASLIKDLICTPTRRGHPFVPTKGCKNGLGLRPKNPTHRNARPESQSDGFPERGLNGAYKVPQAHFYRRCAGAQNGEPPPLSPPQRRGTMGRESKYFLIGNPQGAGPLTHGYG